MSTYLVALILSDFECKETFVQLQQPDPVKISVCARPNAVQQLDLALKVSPKILEFFEQFYKVPYPLPKLGKFKRFKHYFFCF